MNYLVKTKINEKWFTLGSVKENKFGRLQLSLRNTPELKNIVMQGGDWLNLSLFEKTDDNAPKPAPAPAELNDEIPFVWAIGLALSGLVYAVTTASQFA